MREISPTVAYGVPRVWEKYYSGIMIMMSDATWLKKFIFQTSLKVGRSTPPSLPATNRPNHAPVGLFYGHFLTFRKLKERLGFDRVRLAFSGAAPIPPTFCDSSSIGIPLREGYGMTEGTGVTCANQGDRVKIGTVARRFQAWR